MKKTAIAFALALSIITSVCSPFAAASYNPTPNVLTNETVLMDDAPEDPADEETSPSEDTQADDIEDVVPPILESEEHIAYIYGKGKGIFDPDGNLSRAESAQLFYNLLVSKENGQNERVFSDVNPKDWFYVPVQCLSSHSIILGHDDGSFCPEDNVTRGEFIAMLCRFFDLAEGDLPFDDISPKHWAFDYLVTAYQKGWIHGYPNGTLRVENPITRAEAITIINSALNRSGNMEHIMGLHIFPFLDVKPSEWYYAGVIEACTGHEHHIENAEEVWDGFVYPDCGYKPGWNTIGGKEIHVDENRQFELYPSCLQWKNGTYYYFDEQSQVPADAPKAIRLNKELYYINEDGSIAINQIVGNLYFDKEGKYTSKDSNIDANVKQILSTVVTESMTQEEMLRSAYKYLHDYIKADNLHYRPWVLKATHAYPAFGSKSFTQEAATYWFEKGCGNCYCYCAVFLYLARQLGYQAYPVCGRVILYGSTYSPHAWVMIEWSDGNAYAFDPELEARYFSEPWYLYKCNAYEKKPPYYRFP